MRTLLRVDIIAPDQDDLVERVEAWLTGRTAQGWEETAVDDGASVRFRVHLEDAPLARDFAAEAVRDWPGMRVETDTIEEQDWGAAWREFFTPIEIAGLYEILPPWMADKDTKGRLPIVIEPKMAFGTGHHPSTALCLTAFAEARAAGRIRPGMRFFDLGTGSGILGIGLCRLGLTGVGCDIDPQAVWCATENLHLNGVEDSMRLVVGGLGCLADGTVFDIVAANILAAPLAALAGRITRHLVPGGLLVLSGILTTQTADVAAAYRSAGLPEPETCISGEWASLVWL